MTMSEKVEHTELPWSESVLPPAEGLYLLGADGNYVCALAEWDDEGDLIQVFGPAKANAAYIVLACNSYPALLAERDRLREALKPFSELTQASMTVDMSDIRRARAALKEYGS